MKKLQLHSLPVYAFAHIHKADHYHHTIPSNHTRLEVSYLAEGSLTVETSEGKVELRKGDISCFHSSAMIHTDSYHCHHTVCAGVEWQFSDSPGHLLLPSVTPACAATKEIEELIDQFIYQTYLYENSPEKAACDFLQILCKIDQCNRKFEEQDNSGSSILVSRAKKYIHRNLYVPLTQKEVAAHLNITPGYLCSIFRRSEHISVMKYINMLKLKQVRELMEARGMKLYEAAALLGYSDPNYVSALYKKTFGHNITNPPNLSTLYTRALSNSPDTGQ